LRAEYRSTSFFSLGTDSVDVLISDLSVTQTNLFFLQDFFKSFACFHHFFKNFPGNLGEN